MKPHILAEAIKQIYCSGNAKDVKNKLFISILAGITTADLEEVSIIIIKRWIYPTHFSDRFEVDGKILQTIYESI